MEKNFYVATVHIVVPAESRSEAEDAVSACLTQNLELSGAILDWGYRDVIEGKDYGVKDIGLIDVSTYDEGDFISKI